MRCVGFAVGVMLLGAGGVEAGDPAGPRDIALGRHEFRETHMGSEFRILLYTSDPSAASAASRLAFDRIAELDRIASDYEPESELNRLCARAGGPPAPVSDELYRLLDRSLTFARESDGLLDPTLKPLTKLWRRAFRQKTRPPADDLQAARALVDYRTIRLDPVARTAHLSRAGTLLDLGAMAKGFACEEAQTVLKSQGITSALVAAAGDIVVSAPPPGEAGWTIGVGSLEDPTGQPLEVLILHDAGVSTSGDTERFAVIDGVRYSHIVDPRTGLGHVDRASVTVVSPDGTTSDSTDTTIYLMGPEAGFAWLARTHPEASAVFYRQGPHALERVATDNWPGPKNPRTTAAPPTPLDNAADRD
jgi:thiamine biosynthesis lipoprotein